MIERDGKLHGGLPTSHFCLDHTEAIKKNTFIGAFMLSFAFLNKVNRAQPLHIVHSLINANLS